MGFLDCPSDAVICNFKKDSYLQYIEDKTTSICESYIINFNLAICSSNIISREGSTKVVVTFYMRLRNDFQQFPAKHQASDWRTQQVNQLET